MQHLAGLTHEGSTLQSYFSRRYPQGVEAMMESLVRGVNLGWHPTRIARQMRNELGVVAQTAIRTARTEPLRVYRQASLSQYQQSGVVAGYLRPVNQWNDAKAAEFNDRKTFDSALR